MTHCGGGKAGAPVTDGLHRHVAEGRLEHWQQPLPHRLQLQQEQYGTVRHTVLSTVPCHLEYLQHCTVYSLTDLPPYIHIQHAWVGVHYKR